MYGKIKNHLEAELSAVENAGLFKRERVITSAQGADVTVSSGDDVVIMCANNYLGLSSHPDVVEASKKALDLAGWSIKDVDLFEINEAFAAQSIAVLRTLSIPEEKVSIGKSKKSPSSQKSATLSVIFSASDLFKP